MPAIILFFVLASVAHAFSGKAPHPSPAANPSAQVSPKPEMTALPVAPPRIAFQFVSGTQKEKAELIQAEDIANQIVRSECFEHFMLTWGLIWTEGKTASEVVADLRQANKVVPVHYYYARNSTVGYTYPDVDDVYFNRRFHVFYTPCERANNATHEYSHKLGYDHPFRKTADRGRTVPYSISHAFETCCK